MKGILFTAIASIFLHTAVVRAEVQVIQVKRNIPLSENEPVFKDYYLSGGSKSGLRVNLVVPVWRWINLRENSQGQDQSMKILEPVGWLKVIFVQEQFSVGRLYEAADYEQGPIFEQPGIMMGDIISLEKSFMSKPNYKMPVDSAQVVQAKNDDRENEATVPTIAPLIEVKTEVAATAPDAKSEVMTPAVPSAKQELATKTAEVPARSQAEPNLIQGPKPASVETTAR